MVMDEKRETIKREFEERMREYGLALEIREDWDSFARGIVLVGLTINDAHVGIGISEDMLTDTLRSANSRTIFQQTQDRLEERINMEFYIFKPLQDSTEKTAGWVVFHPITEERETLEQRKMATCTSEADAREIANACNHFSQWLREDDDDDSE